MLSKSNIKKHKKIFIVALGLMVMLVTLFFMLPKQSYDASGTSSDVLTSTSFVKQYLINKYGDTSATITAGSETKIATSNYSQSSLNSYYKNSTGIAVDGTCSEVATTSLIEFYSDMEHFTTNSSYQDTFVDILTLAMNKGYYSVSNGTTQTKLDNLLAGSFNLYGSSHKGDNDYYRLYSIICGKVDSGVPVLFSIVGHTMVACGYVTYTTTYTTSSGSRKTATDNFVIVNDGWSNTRQYSYFPEDSISTNVFTRWEFCVTKAT